MQTQPQLTAAIDVATTELQAGITAVLRSWSAFRTAVDSEWGGTDSRTKAENLRKHIYQCFDYQKHPNTGITLEDLEIELDTYMEEEFTIVLEDDSEKHVAQIIFELYEKCAKGDFSLSRKLIAESQTSAGKKRKPQIQSVGENEDSDTDDENGVDKEETTGLNSRSNYAGQSVGFLFGPPPGTRIQKDSLIPSRQLGEAAPEKMKVEVDEDGFMPIQKKKKGKR